MNRKNWSPLPARVGFDSRYSLAQASALVSEKKRTNLFVQKSIIKNMVRTLCNREELKLTTSMVKDASRDTASKPLNNCNV